MKKYQISLEQANMATAGSKAPRDITIIAQEQGYRTISLSSCEAKKNLFQKIGAKLNRLTGYCRGWRCVYRTVEAGSSVLLQIPNEYTGYWGRKALTGLCRKKGVRLICLLHDVDELRLAPSKYLTNSKKLHDFSMELADAVIAHNDTMVAYLQSQGVDPQKLISLDIFDYLADSRSDVCPTFRREVVIAGNLDPQKCGYIAQLGALPQVNWTLYGPNYDTRLDACENVDYRGVAKPEELPRLLSSGFGLIWDGNSPDGCCGSMGAYLRYNNPHKLSLYLSAGLPVVIWSEAAEAEFVRRNEVGICIHSLHQLADALNEITEETYAQMAQNVAATGDKLRSGYYLRAALSRSEALFSHTH